MNNLLNTIEKRDRKIISFDFDGTLTLMEEYKYHSISGMPVYNPKVMEKYNEHNRMNDVMMVTTSREISVRDNVDEFIDEWKLNISTIHFTNGEDKADYFNRYLLIPNIRYDSNPIIHYDNDAYEVEQINLKCPHVKSIYVSYSKHDTDIKKFNENQIL